MRGVDWWSLAVRRPDETIGLHHWPLVSWMKRYPDPQAARPAGRRGPRRVAGHRHPRPHHLGQRVAGRGGAGAGQEGDRRHARHRLRLRHRPLLHRAALPHRADGALARRGLPLLDGRGLRARRDLPRLPGRRHPDQGPAPRVRVPRRRAHEHPRARARRGAHGRQRREVQDPAPALRHVVPAHRARGLDLRLRGGRTPAVVPAHPQPRGPRPAHRRHQLRDHQVRRAPRGEQGRPRRHGARPRAAVDDHQDSPTAPRSRWPSPPWRRSSSWSRRTARRRRAWRSWRKLGPWPPSTT